MLVTPLGIGETARPFADLASGCLEKYPDVCLGMSFLHRQHLSTVYGGEVAFSFDQDATA